jgi:hypothetical protein
MEELETAMSEGKVRLQFHTPPSIDHLHMHVLIGDWIDPEKIQRNTVASKRISVRQLKSFLILKEPSLDLNVFFTEKYGDSVVFSAANRLSTKELPLSQTEHFQRLLDATWHPMGFRNVWRDEGCHRWASRLKIERVVRILNPWLRAVYDKAKADVIEEWQNRDSTTGWNMHLRENEICVAAAKATTMASDLNEDINECMLFHGTSLESCYQIAASGFRQKECQELLGRRYGDGHYFGEFASKCDKYVDPGPSGSKSVLLCKVILGRSSYTTDFHAKVPRGYHSLIGDQRDAKTFDPHREFVVYQDRLIYPCYIIEYTREHSEAMTACCLGRGT